MIMEKAKGKPLDETHWAKLPPNTIEKYMADEAIDEVSESLG